MPIEKSNNITFMEVMEENPEYGKTPEGLAYIIYVTVSRYFKTILQADRPSWETKLLIREFLAPSSALPAIGQKFCPVKCVPHRRVLQNGTARYE